MRVDRRLLMALSLCLGCAHIETRVIHLGRPAPPLPRDAAVIVRVPPLASSALPAREVALIEVSSGGSGDRAEVVSALRQVAREVGADVVLWMREDFIDGFGRVIASAVRTRGAPVPAARR